MDVVFDPETGYIGILDSLVTELENSLVTLIEDQEEYRLQIKYYTDLLTSKSSEVDLTREALKNINDLLKKK